MHTSQSPKPYPSPREGGSRSETEKATPRPKLLPHSNPAALHLERDLEKIMVAVTKEWEGKNRLPANQRDLLKQLSIELAYRLPMSARCKYGPNDPLNTLHQSPSTNEILAWIDNRVYIRSVEPTPTFWQIIKNKWRAMKWK